MHALLAYFRASPRRSPPEVSAQFASRECGLASPTPGPDPERHATSMETGGPCPLVLAFTHLEPMEECPLARPA